MKPESSFDPTDRPTSGQTRGGLDRFLAPAARHNSKMPPALEDAKANEDEQREADCTAADADEPICDLADAVQEKRRSPDPQGKSPPNH